MPFHSPPPQSPVPASSCPTTTHHLMQERSNAHGTPVCQGCLFLQSPIMQLGQSEAQLQQVKQNRLQQAREKRHIIIVRFSIWFYGWSVGSIHDPAILSIHPFLPNLHPSDNKTEFQTLVLTISSNPSIHRHHNNSRHLANEALVEQQRNPRAIW